MRAAILGGDFMGKLQAFHAQTRMKRVALTAVAQHLPDAEIRPLQRTFRFLDKNGDGMLSPEELYEGLMSLGEEVPPAWGDILRSIDSDGSGCLDYTEFVAATIDSRLYAQRGVCWAAFRTFDLDGDGKITQEELSQVLGGGDAEKSPCASRIARMVSEADCNGDGCIDFEEFYEMMTGPPGTQATQERTFGFEKAVPTQGAQELQTDLWTIPVASALKFEV